ncbi:MAG: response regulator [Magnetococcales bacterium]|nr:response regulator [Magnetococcales bacterium]
MKQDNTKPPILSTVRRLIREAPFRLRVVAGLGVAGLVLAFAGSLLLISGQRSMTQMVSMLTMQMADTAHHRVNSYLEAPTRAVLQLRDMIRLGHLDIHDRKSLMQWLREQSGLHAEVIGMIVSTPTGELWGFNTLPDGRESYLASDTHTGHHLIAYKVNDDASRGNAIIDAGPYDPRKRPWFKQALKAGEPVWSSVFRQKETGVPIIALLVPIYQRGVLHAVINATITLSDLSHNLRDNHMGHQGLCIVIEENGAVIASSELTPLFDDEGKRTHMGNLKDPVLKQIYATIKKLPNDAGEAMIDHNGQRMIVRAHHFHNKHALKWRIISAMDNAEFLDPIMQREHWTRITALGFALLSLVIMVSVITHLWREIARRKETEQALRRSKRRFNQLFHKMITGFAEHEIICDKSGTPVDYRFTDVNPAFEEITSLSGKSVIGKRVRSIIPNIAPSLIETYGKVALTGESIEFVQYSNEFKKHFMIHAFQTKPDCFAILFLDISTLKKIEQALKKARQQAEQASQAKSDFLATMSHEIRTPMNGILGMVELLKRSGLKKDQMHKVEMILQAGQTLKKLLHDVLDISKIEAQELTLEETPFRLRDKIESVRQMFSQAAREKGIRLNASVAGDVPDNLIGDEARLSQVLVNLLGNALKFTDFGEISCQVTLKLERGNHVILSFSISDTGIGISEAHHDRIFKRLFQVDPTDPRSQGGTGLGLAISKSLVELLGGEIHVISTPGEGSRFHFSSEFLIDESPTANSAIDPKAALAIKGTTVLLVEDEPINRIVGEGLLNSEGYRVTAVEDGYKALELLQQHHFDLILMDVRMPGIDGVETTRRIRQELPRPASETPVIGLTADALKKSLAQCREVGMARVMVKPIDMEQFNRLAAELIHGIEA